MIDVFLTTMAEDPLRKTIFKAVFIRWCESYSAQIHVINPVFKKSPTEFMLWHKTEAERLSKTDIYCHADDDCMPLGNQFLEKAVEIMNAHPEYGLIAFTDHLYDKYWQRDPDYGTDPYVWEQLSAGGLYLIRKGILKFPESHPWFCDTTMSEQIRSKGFKVGRFKKLMFNHMGYKLSTCYPERTGVTQVVDP